MSVLKIGLMLSIILVPRAFAGDAGAAFMPEGESVIKMKGSVKDDELTCKDSKKQDCQEIFDKVFDILNGPNFDDLDRGRVIDGYIKYKGKKRKNVKFISEVKEYNGTEERRICEYDAKNEKVKGLVWVDPSVR